MNKKLTKLLCIAPLVLLLGCDDKNNANSESNKRLAMYFEGMTAGFVIGVNARLDKLPDETIKQEYNKRFSTNKYDKNK